MVNQSDHIFPVSGEMTKNAPLRAKATETDLHKQLIKN